MECVLSNAIYHTSSKGTPSSAAFLLAANKERRMESLANVSTFGGVLGTVGETCKREPSIELLIYEHTERYN